MALEEKEGFIQNTEVDECEHGVHPKNDCAVCYSPSTEEPLTTKEDGEGN